MSAPMPNGWCWCDCGGRTKPSSYFLQGHDKRADRYLDAIDGSQSIAEKLATLGYMPPLGSAPPVQTATRPEVGVLQS